MQFRVLGPLDVTDETGSIPLGGPRQRLVLAHLLLRANRVVPADRLIDEVWDDDPPEAARNVVQTYVSRLRKALGSERLESASGGYLLRADPSEVDAHTFTSLVDEARRTATVDPEAAVRLYRQADGLWRGPVLDDLADQPSLRGDVARLEELRAAAVESRVVAELALGRHAELVPELEALTARDPLRERLWAHLITALYRSGRQADALAAYRRARRILADELGLDPSVELQQLERQVLRQDPALEADGVPLRGFRLLERVGEGSFGVVHRALQPQVGREVAVKVVRPSLANDPEFIRRFEAEAQLVARLEHPHIVPLYDYWREPDGAFLVMRFLRGGSLRDTLARGALDVDRALGVVDHVGAALASAHRQGVVHRDVKPANVLFDEEGNAFLSDFGIATDVAAARMTQGGRTPSEFAYYLSPEEIRGGVPTSAADVYSLGLVLYEMLAGEHPFSGSSPEAVADRHLHDALPELRTVRTDLPAEIDQVVQRATLKDPDARYPDAAAFVSALAAAADATSRPVAVSAGAIRNPFKGLRPFLEADAPDFFGREALVRRLVDRLASGAGSRLLAVVGPSGSGKSSVVRAGLVPAVRAGALPGAERSYVAEMLPGAQPFEALAAALLGVAHSAPPPDLAGRLERDDEGLVDAAASLLPDDHAELLLVIDQFEELFTLVTDEDRRVRFLAALQAAATSPRSRVRVVVTIRADFVDRPLARGGFAELVRAGSELVVPLTAEELEHAVTRPASRAGVTVPGDLVARLVADVIGQPGALPLLQFALAELFDRRAGAALTLGGYHDLGGVAGAVAAGAEDVYAALGEARREAVRQLFLRLVDVGDGTESRRLRMPVSDLRSLTEDAVEMDAAIEAFAGRRLLSFDRDADTRAPTIEVAHDALLRAWDRLRLWIEDSRDDLRLQRQLATAAGEWLEADREPSFLVGGSRLEQLESWRERSGLSLTVAEQDFLSASVAERDRLAADAAVREARERELERRSLRRLRGLVAVLGAASAIATGLTVFAFEQREEAERERRIAVVRELASAALANLDVDAERSILLALEAIERTRPGEGAVRREAEEALHRAVVASRIVLRVPDLGGALDWSPDGSRFVTEGPEESGVVDIRDAATGRSVRSFRGHDPDVNLVAFNGDGSLLATSGDDGAVRVWDPATGERLRSFAGTGGQVWGVSFGPGSLLAASFWDEGVVRVWSLDTGRRVAELGPLTPSFTTSFSPDGRRLAIADFDSGGVVADVRSGEVLFTLGGHDSGALDVDWSPDGRWIATSSLDSTVRVRDARTGRTRFTLAGHKGEVVAADWSADSRRLVTGSNDGTARVWEIGASGTRELLSISVQERGGGLWVAFSPDGTRVMTGDQEITAVKIFDVSRTGDAEWANVSTALSHLAAAAFTPDGRGVVASTGDASVALWDAETGERRSLLGRRREPPPSLALDVSSRGDLAVAFGSETEVWETATGTDVFGVSSAGIVADVAWNADGSLLATAGVDGVAAIVDRAGTTVRELREEPGFRVSGVRFSPDGRLLAAARIATDRPGTGGDRVTIWDWERSEIVRTIAESADAVAFSPDGTWIATAPPFGPVRVWDLRSGDEVSRLVGHTGTVRDVAFAPDGSVVATGSVDGTVRLWDPRAGVQVLVLRGHAGAVSDLAFGPDGSKLASAGPEGSVRVWALALDDLVAIAKRNVTRALTPEECRQYLRVPRCS